MSEHLEPGFKELIVKPGDTVTAKSINNIVIKLQELAWEIEAIGSQAGNTEFEIETIKADIKELQEDFKKLK